MRLNHEMLGIGAMALFVASPVFATDYPFTVSCADQRGRHVVIWHTGDIDPGREYLRVATGINYPSCSISDYQDALDHNLRVENLRGTEAMANGIPLPIVGPMLSNLFGHH